MFRFQHKEYLLALVAVLLLGILFFILLKWKKNKAAKMGDVILIKELTASFSKKKFLFKFLFSVAALALLIIAIANPQKPGALPAINRSGIDIMFAVDVSKSMQAEDVQPSRIDKAKQLLGKLAGKLSGNRIGIVVFAGKAYQQMPLTADNSAVRLFISAINTNMVPAQGTVLGEALAMCNSSFNSNEKKYKAVVMISDGEDHDATATAIAQQMHDQGVIINTAGIGTPEGVPIINAETGDYKKDIEGNTIITKLNENLLKDIAAISEGSYINVEGSSDEAASAIATQIMAMEQKNITDKSFVNYKSFFQWFAGISLLLLLLDFFLSEKKQVKPKFAFVFMLLLPMVSLAQKDYDHIKKGNEAYLKTDYATASSNYLMADTANTIAQYNLGNALYKQSKVEEALAAYDKAIGKTKDNALRSMAFYNKGVVLQSNNRLAECIEAYKQALRINPDDEDARQNLQKALKKVQQQKPKQKPNKPKEQKDKKQEKPKEGQQTPKPQPSRISRQEAEEKLKVMQEKEKTAQDKMQKARSPSANKPEKDW